MVNRRRGSLVVALVGFSCHGRFVLPPGGGKGHVYFGCLRGRKVVTFVHN
jgi:hypothetical protein